MFFIARHSSLITWLVTSLSQRPRHAYVHVHVNDISRIKTRTGTAARSALKRTET